MQSIAIDLGGTHARFVAAEYQNGKIHWLGAPIVLEAAQFESFIAAWTVAKPELAKASGGNLPSIAVIAVAASLDQPIVQLTNNRWRIVRAALASDMGLARAALVNDFGAVAHAVPQFQPADLAYICGAKPQVITSESQVTIIGFGTGIGVAHRHAGKVIETEGGHGGFSPYDEWEEKLLHAAKAKFGRVSNERLMSGSGLLLIYRQLLDDQSQNSITKLANSEAVAAVHKDYSHDREVWIDALNNNNPLAELALARYCAMLGSYTGDIVLASGAQSLLIGGGLGLRLAPYLPHSEFAQRFFDKGRMRQRQELVSVQVILHPQPGLLGAAAAAIMAA